MQGNLPNRLPGKFFYNEENITWNSKSHELIYKGVYSRTFQIAHEFTTLTVLENLMMVPGNQSSEKILIDAWFNPITVVKKTRRKNSSQKLLKVIEFFKFNSFNSRIGR